MRINFLSVMSLIIQLQIVMIQFTMMFFVQRPPIGMLTVSTALFIGLIVYHAYRIGAWMEKQDNLNNSGN